MRSIRLLVQANLRRRKARLLLVALSIAVSTTALATAIPILLGVSGSIDATFDRLRASHLLMVFDTQACNPTAVVDWWSGRPETAGLTAAIPTKALYGGFWHNDRHVDQAVVLFERPVDELPNDRLFFVEGSATPFPEHGTVWLTNTLAAGNRIAVGDVIQVPVPQGVHDLTVAAVVVDANYSSGLVSPTRVWVAPGELAMLFPVEQLHEAAVGVRLDDPARVQSAWNDFMGSFGHTFNGYKLDYDIFSNCYLVVFRLLGVILLLVSGVALVLVLVFVFATIQSAVLSDTRSIGVLQSVGMTVGGIELTYVVQFALVSLAAVPVGLLGSYFALRLVLSFTLRSLGTAGADVAVQTPLVLTGLVLPIAVMLTAYLAARRCRRVRPAEAIRYGVPVAAPKGRPGVGIWKLPHLPVPVGLAVRGLLARKRKAVVPMLAIAFAATMATFSVNTVQTISAIGRNMALWGWDKADLEIVRGGRRLSVTHEEILERLGQDRRIAGIVPRSHLEAQVAGDGRFPSRLIQGYAYRGDMDQLGVVNVSGRNPRNDSEVSIAVGTARDCRKTVGDSFELGIEGRTLPFTVVGIYQTLDNLGQGFRVQASGIWRADPLFEPASYGVRLVDASQAESFIRDVERQFGEAARAQRTSNLQIASVTDSMSAALAAVSGLFLLMALVFVVESAYVSVQEEYASFSILKTLGMTPFQMRLVCVCKLLLIACAGLAVAIPLGTVLTPVVFNLLLPAFGVVAFPMEVAVAPLLALVAMVLLLTAAAAWLPAGAAGRASPRQFNLE
jgi:putative ABC transport system permease protein